jgi:hypothetical protein
MGVADQLCGQLCGNCRREELCRLDLLGHDARLRLRTCSRRVIAGEGEEHYEPEQYGKSGGEDPEDASGAVAVVEVAAVGCLATHPEHGRDRDAGRCHHDEDRDREIHRATIPSTMTRRHAVTEKTKGLEALISFPTSRGDRVGPGALR